MSRLLLAFVFMTLAACGPPRWHNVDVARDTLAAFKWDEDACRRESLYRNMRPRWGENPLFPYLVVDEDRAADCMKARGWQPGNN